VASQLDAKELTAAKDAVRTFTAQPQPAAATTVPQPAGGWDAAAPAAPSERQPKARASTGIKIGRK
jgi:localization factor PodJL